jgi:hypothetical protein
MSGDFGATLGQLWQQILDVISKVVSPDWGALIGLIPLLVAPLVVLFILVTVLRWAAYEIRRPRTHLRYVEGPTPLARDESGAPIPPIGQPFSLAAGLAYPHGTTRTPDGRDLAVICPMCRVERPAALSTCGNCGLVLTISRSIQVARPAGPPPGGAALA